jgi:hypothetical protein
MGPMASWFFQMNPIKSQFGLNTALSPHPISDELPAPADDLTVYSSSSLGTHTRFNSPLANSCASFRLSRRSVLTRWSHATAACGGLSDK